MPALVIQSGKRKGNTLVLPENDAEVIIGRDEDCQIRLSSDDVSRKHCVLRNTAEGLVVRDLGSRNGTQVNDVTITDETRLSAGDLLRVGPMVFQVAGQQNAVQLATDDDIADWLGDDDSEKASGDTTVLNTFVAPEPPKKFSSIAEEGADIIRRHLVKVQQREGQQRDS